MNDSKAWRISKIFLCISLLEFLWAREYANGIMIQNIQHKYFQICTRK
jgi:hypothetical protein